MPGSPINASAINEPPVFAVNWITYWKHLVDVAPIRDDYAWDAATGWQTWAVTRFTTTSGRR